MNPKRLVSAKDKDNNLDLKKQNSNKLAENNNVIAKQSDKLVIKITNSQDKNNKPLELKKVKSDVSSNLNNIQITTSTEATCNSDNLNIIKKRESEKKELQNIENFFDKKKENLNRYFFVFKIIENQNPFHQKMCLTKTKKMKIQTEIKISQK